jgi:hypothetical protein
MSFGLAISFLMVGASALAGTTLTEMEACAIFGGCPVVCEDFICPNGHEVDDPCEDNLFNCGCYSYWERVSRVAGPGGTRQFRESCCGVSYDCDLEITPEGKFRCVKKENYCPTGCIDPWLSPDAKYKASYMKCY